MSRWSRPSRPARWDGLQQGEPHGDQINGRSGWRRDPLDTGWFQTAVAANLLVELGYAVDGPHTLENHEFYRQVAKGEVDLWVNGWFPAHWQYVEGLDEPDAVVPVGFTIPIPAPQGYLIDRQTAERLSISELSDLADPAIAAAFDLDGDGQCRSDRLQQGLALCEGDRPPPRGLWTRGHGGPRAG